MVRNSSTKPKKPSKALRANSLRHKMKPIFTETKQLNMNNLPATFAKKQSRFPLT